MSAVNDLDGRTPRQFVLDLFSDLFLAPREDAAATAARWTTPDTTQTTDGTVVVLAQQIEHIQFVRDHATEVDFDVQQVVFDGTWLAERHIGHIAFADGRAVDSEVQTFFKIRGNRIAEAHEMTRPLSGEESDRSVHTAH